MFIEINELGTAIAEHTMGMVQADDAAKRVAILAAIQEMTGYLRSKYDTTAIFNAAGDERNVLIMEHCKSIAVWYIIRRSNADIVFEKAKFYYDSAIGWLKDVAGVGPSGKTIAPDLPLKKNEQGEVQNKIRMGGNKKFNHYFGE